MKTITLDILDDKAINLLRDLEAVNIVKLHNDADKPVVLPLNLAAKYSGAMTKQSIKEIEQQFNDLRNEWD